MYDHEQSFYNDTPCDHAALPTTGVSLSPEDVSDSGSIPDDVVVQRMMAIFEYDPWESSPNPDSDAELGFRSGDIIYVFGDMDQDGFYFVSSKMNTRAKNTPTALFNGNVWFLNGT